jgi:tetratricopeptide (TPR) repeat protein
LNLYHQGISFYEDKGQKVNAGLLYIEASEVANFQNDHTTSKDYINKAIFIFKEADIPEFMGEAGLRKATLLYTWSKNGSPQYYKPAINAFQDTLKVFKKDTHPQKFADVHHKLALIYSEIPVSPEEKPIWTAFCASSFEEVLKFYTKESFPYEFAMACHKLHDNLNKAYQMFEDALNIRTAESYPLERALTLINQLELYWIMHNKDSEEEVRNYNTMLDKAHEIKQLVKDKTIMNQADEHIEALYDLKKVLH